MIWNELLQVTGLSQEIKVTIINPIRKDSFAKEGRLTGFKSGIGTAFKFKRDKYGERKESTPWRWIKKPKVHVTYSAFIYGKNEISDWIDIDNCTFEIIYEDMEAIIEENHY